MIPCRLFLQSFQLSSDPPHKVKINLTLNSLFYDEIKPFQTKYFCLIQSDIIGVEIVFQDNENIIGKTEISECARRALENQSIELNILPMAQIGLKTIKLKFLIEPVSSFSRKQLGTSTKNIKLPINIQEQGTNRAQISFSNRDPLIDSQEMLILSKGISPRDNFNETLKTVEEADSLESLAHQREKILGELFGRFKRDK